MRKGLVILALSAAGLSLGGPEAQATDYCVSTSGKNSNSGRSRNSCFATAEHAASKVKAGDRVCFMSGTHEGMVIRKSGSEKQPITWKRCNGVGRGRVQLVPTKKRKYGVIEAQRGARYNILDGLDFHESIATAGVGGLWMWGNNDGWEIRDMRYVGKKRSGAELWKIARSRGKNGRKNRNEVFRVRGEKLWIHDNYVRYWPFQIFAESEGARRILVEDNDFAYSGSHVISADSNCEGQSELLTGNTYRHNYIGQSWTSDGWQMSGGRACKGGYRITQNIFYASAENAIDGKGLANSVIESNFFAAHTSDSGGPGNGYNKGCGGTVGAGSGATSENILVRNNTFYDNASAISANNGWAVYNNTIVSMSRTGRDSKSSKGGKGCGVQGIGDAHKAPTVVNNVILTEGAAVSEGKPRWQYLDGNVYYAKGRFRSSLNSSWKYIVGFDNWENEVKRTRAKIAGREQNSVGVGKVTDALNSSSATKSLDYPFTNVTLSDVLKRAGNFRSKYGSGGAPVAVVKSSSSGKRVKVGSQWSSFCCRWPVHPRAQGKDEVIINGSRYRIVDIDRRKGELILNRSVRVKSGDGIDVDYPRGGTSRQRGSHGASSGISRTTYELLRGIAN